jgi:CHAD domain-containing protein
MPRWTRVLDRPLAALEKALPAALEGEPESVHAARIASRRVREGLAILGRGLGQGGQRKLVRQFRRVTRLLGRVRELDVALDLVDQLVPGEQALAQDVSAIKATLTASRGQELAASARRIRTEDMAKLRERLAAEVVGLRRAGWDWRAAARAHLETQARRLSAAVERTRVLYEPGRLHVARIALKRFRYTVELVADAEGRSAKRTIRSLKAAQDILGRMHDLHVLTEHLRADIDRTANRAQLLLLIEAEIRREHARYLLLRNRLEQLVGECVHRFCA